MDIARIKLAIKIKIIHINREDCCLVEIYDSNSDSIDTDNENPTMTVLVLFLFKENRM